MTALVNADHGPERREHDAFGSEVAGEELQAPVQEEQRRPAAFALDVKSRTIDLHEPRRMTRRHVGSNRRNGQRADQRADEDRPSLHAASPLEGACAREYSHIG